MISINKNIFLPVIALFCIFHSCTDKQETDIENSSLQELDMIWKSPSIEESLAFNFNPVIGQEIVIYSWHTVTPAVNPLVGYDKNTGEKVWEWSDYFYNPEYVGGSNRMYQYNGNLVFTSAFGNLYCIDINSGETIWKHEGLGSRPQVRGYENYVLSTFKNTDFASVYLTDIETGESREVKRYLNEGNYSPRLNTPLLFRDNEGDLVFYQKYNMYNAEENPQLLSRTLSYNIDKELILYEGTGIIDDINYEYFDGKIYGTTLPGGEELVCIDAETFEILWRSESPGGTGWGHMLITEDFILHGSRDNIENEVYCRDRVSGDVLWKSPGISLNSRIKLYNDIVYFVYGDLHGLSLQTGEEIVRISSPEIQINEGAFFDNKISIDQETGRIFLANYMSALCYEPLR